MKQILLVDDHLMVLEGYSSILSTINNKVHKLTSCEEVYHWVTKGNTCDFAIIDHDLPAFEEKKIFSGVDCALLIKEHLPNCKIIIITAHEKALFLYNIYNKVRPDALINKADFTVDLIQKIMTYDSNDVFLSKTVSLAIKEITNKMSLLDSLNREILMYLSQGFKISQLENFVFLSTSGIQKRVTKMLHEFEMKDYHELIQVLRKNGIL